MSTPPPPAEPRAARIGRRVAWTLAAVAAMLLAGRVTLPGINRVELAHLLGASELSWGAMSVVSVIMLGLRPLIMAFVCVELVALVVPRWRPLRHVPEGRRRLAYAVAVTGIVLALVQAYFTALYLEALSRSGVEILALHMRWLIVVTLVGGTMFLAWLASVIGARGIGNGYAVLLVAGWLMSPNWKSLGDQSVPPLVIAVTAIAAVVVIVVVLTRMSVVSPGGAPITLPSSGLVPLSDVGGLVLALKQVMALGLVLPLAVAKFLYSVESRPGFALAILIPSTLLWSWLFARPALRANLLARAGYAETSRRTWIKATVLSAIALAAIFGFMFGARRYVPQLGVLGDPFVVAFIAATLLDMIEEARDRRRALVPVWPLHDPMLAPIVRESLRAAKIPHHLQASRLRTLLWFFGPYVPIMVLVPDEHAAAAEKQLRELLAP